MHGGDIYNNRVDHDHSVNLNPYLTDPKCRDTDGYSESVKKMLRDAQLEGLELGGLYPDPEQKRLREELGKLDGVGSECVLAGCGASQLLMAICSALYPKTALLAEPSFSGYKYALKASGASCIKQHFLREEDGFLLTEDILQSLSDDIDVLFLTDPNNPTGKNIDGKLLGGILDTARRKNIYVIVDESFYTISDAFCNGRSRELIGRYDNLFIIRSFTKSFSLPGIRMGYVIAAPQHIAKIREKLPEWNLPALSEKVMLACAKISEDGRMFERSARLIRSERDYLSRRLTDLGFKVYDSDTVFLLVKGPAGLYEKLLERGILIRKCDDFKGLESAAVAFGSDFYRIAVKDHEENVHLTDILREMIKG